MSYCNPDDVASLFVQPAVISEQSFTRSTLAPIQRNKKYKEGRRASFKKEKQSHSIRILKQIALANQTKKRCGMSLIEAANVAWDRL